MARKKEELVGTKLGVISIISESSKSGQRRFDIKCDICGKEKRIWHSQYSTGDWKLCEHDLM